MHLFAKTNKIEEIDVKVKILVLRNGADSFQEEFFNTENSQLALESIIEDPKKVLGKEK